MNFISFFSFNTVYPRSRGGAKSFHSGKIPGDYVTRVIESEDGCNTKLISQFKTSLVGEIMEWKWKFLQVLTAAPTFQVIFSAVF